LSRSNWGQRPNPAVEPTPSSVRCAPASGRGSPRALGCCCAALLSGVALEKRRCSPAVSGATPRCPCVMPARPAGPMPGVRRSRPERLGSRTGGLVVSGRWVGVVWAPSGVEGRREGLGGGSGLAGGARARTGSNAPAGGWGCVAGRGASVWRGSGGVLSCAMRGAAGAVRRAGGRWCPAGVGGAAGSAEFQSARMPQGVAPGRVGRGRARWCKAPPPPMPGAASATISRGSLGVAISCGRGGAGVSGGGRSAGGPGIRVRPQHPNTALAGDRQ